MAICPFCGASVPDDTRFCTECGAKIEAGTASAAPAPEVPDAPVFPAESEVSAAPFAPASEPVFPGESPEKPEPPYQAPAAPAAPAYTAPTPAPAAPVYPAPAPAADADRPGKKSKYAPMTSWGMAIEWILMSIPVIGFVLMILWACGVCRKVARRNLARAYLIIVIIAIVLAIVLALLARFAFSDVITGVVEKLLPGYTIQWG